MATKAATTLDALGDYAMAFPGATEAFPWGERVVKVAKKVFVFFGRKEESGEISIAVKLPVSAHAALTMPFAEPTHYGLGKRGWVTAKFAKGERAPVALLREWIDESYRAVAPKKLIAQLATRGAPVAKPPMAIKKSARKAAPKRASKDKKPKTPATMRDAKKTPKRRGNTASGSSSSP